MCFFLHPVPVCMRICEFCHLFPPAHNGLFLRKAEQDLTCAKDVLRAFAHGTSVYSLIRRRKIKQDVWSSDDNKWGMLLNEYCLCMLFRFLFIVFILYLFLPKEDS